MLKHSSGILAYRNINDEVEVLLCHMGGPYWCDIDEGAWSIPKGEFKRSEKAMEAAIREFREETNFDVEKKDLNFLGSNKQLSNKLVTVFYINHNYDVSQATSNTFEMEWPKGSGIRQSFPEMDKIKWMSLKEAKRKILKGQVYFIKKLEMKVR